MATETKSTVTVNIVSRWDSSEILFSAEVDTSISEPLRIRVALEIAVKNRARLDRASLVGASLDDGSTLTGNRPIFMLGPIGSASRTFAAYCTLQGLRLRAGCFFGTREQFLAQLNKTHGTDSAHAREYMAALAMIDAHVALWSPAEAPALLEKVAV